MTNNLVGKITNSFSGIRGTINQLAGSISAPIRNALNTVRSAARMTATQVRQHFTGMMTDISTAFGTMGTRIRARAGALGSYLMQGSFGRAMHNFALGARAGFVGHLPGFYPGFTRRFGTMAARMGVRAGAVGSLAMQAGQGAMYLGGMARRGAYNVGLGAYRGFMNIPRPLTTLSGRVGRAIGVGARFAGAAGGALIAGGAGLGRLGGAGAMALGRLGLGAVGGMGRGLQGALGGVAGAGGLMASGMGRAFASIKASAASTFAYLTSSVRRLGYDFQYLGRRLSFYLTIPIMGIGVASMNAFAKFDDAMTTSLALMGKVGPGTRKAMEKTVFDISSKSRTAPTDAALGYYHLASAGYRAADAMKVLSTVEKFAVSGAFDLNESGHAAGGSLYAMGRATNYLVDIQAALGKRVEDSSQNLKNMTEIADQLTKANQIANGTVDDFAKALTGKGAAAIRLLNKDLSEGLAVLSAYAAQGVKAEAAGEKLYILTRDLQRSVLKHSQAWKSLGVSVYDNTGKMKNLADIIEQLEKVFAPMSDEQKRSTLMLMGFQDRSLAATIQILGMSKSIRQYQSQLESAGGTMQEVANERLKSFTSQMMMLRNQITIAAIGVGQVLVPYMMKLNGVLESGLKYWQQLSEPMKRWSVAIALIAAAAGPVIVFLGVIATSLASLMSAFGVIGTITAGIIAAITAWPVTFAAAFGAVVALIIGSGGLIPAFKKASASVYDFVITAVGFMEHFSDNWKILISWIQRNWFNVIKDVGNIFLTTLSNMTSNLGVWVETGMQIIMAFTGWLGRQFVEFWSGGFNNAINEGLKKAALKLVGFSTTVINLFSAIAKNAPMEIAKATVGITNFVGGLMNTSGKAFLENNLGKTIQDIMDKQKGKLKSPLQGFTSSTTDRLEFFTDIAKPAEEAAAEVAEVGKEIAAVRDDAQDPIHIQFEVGGVEALRAGSAKAMRALADFRRMQEGGGPAGAVNAVAGMGVGVPTGGLGGAGKPDFVGGMKVLRDKNNESRKAAQGKRAEMRAAYNLKIREKHLRPFKFSGSESPIETGIDPTDAKLGAIAADPFKAPRVDTKLDHRPEPTSEEISALLGEIKGELTALNETETRRARDSIEVEFANLAGGE